MEGLKERPTVIKKKRQHSYESHKIIGFQEGIRALLRDCVVPGESSGLGNRCRWTCTAIKAGGKLVSSVETWRVKDLTSALLPTQ